MGREPAMLSIRERGRESALLPRERERERTESLMYLQRRASVLLCGSVCTDSQRERAGERERRRERERARVRDKERERESSLTKDWPLYAPCFDNPSFSSFTTSICNTRSVNHTKKDKKEHERGDKSSE